MGERTIRSEEMATTSAAVATVPPPLQEETPGRVAVITLRAPHSGTNKKVAWTQDTVDNEDMNKKKSKCCCIYEKPHKFGESSSSDSEDECEHCFGHVERRKKRTHGTATTSADGTQTQVVTEEEPQPESTATITLQNPPKPHPHSVA